MSTLKVVPNYEELSIHVANKLIKTIQEKPNASVCLAAGKSPLGIFNEFINRVNELSLDVSQVTFIGLDEWVGVNGETVGSCRYTMNHCLFEPLGIAEEKIVFFDGMVTPIESEKERVLAKLDQLQGIDFILLGVGMNGHLGFNEPHVSMDERVAIVPLDPITLEVSGVDVQTDSEMTQGITIGLKEIIASKQVVIIANGEAKGSIMQKVLEGDQTIEVPASLLTKYTHVDFIIDELAATYVNK